MPWVVHVVQHNDLQIASILLSRPPLGIDSCELRFEIKDERIVQVWAVRFALGLGALVMT